MSNLRCADYGFQCKIEAEGNIDSVVEEFGRHTEEEHGIDYPKEALMQFVIRKKW